MGLWSYMAQTPGPEHQNEALIYFNFYELLPQRTVPHVDENKENPQAKLLEEPSVCFIGHSTGLNSV